MAHWFGLKPPEGEEYSSLVGARAIYDKRGEPYMADFLSDRFSYEGRVADGGDKDLILWMNQSAIPTIKQWVQQSEPAVNESWSFVGIPYSPTARVSPYTATVRASSDYIYCAFWRSPKSWEFQSPRQARDRINQLLPDAKFKVKSQTVIPEGGTLDDVQQIFIIDCFPEDREMIGSIIAGSNAWLKKEAEVPS